MKAIGLSSAFLIALFALAAFAQNEKPERRGPRLGDLPDQVKKLRARYRWINGTLNHQATAPVRQIKSVDAHFGPRPRADRHPFFSLSFQRGLDRVTHSRLTAGNDLRLLPNGDSGREKFRLMKEARKTLFVATMVFHCDDGGRAFTQALIDAKNRGVDVRLIVDGIMLWAMPPCMGDLNRGGVKVSVSGRSVTPGRVDWEMHDKLFIVDGGTRDEVAIVGGQNIGTWYFESNGTDDNYRDTDVRVRGPVARQIARRFVSIWRELNPRDATLESYEADLLDADAKDAARGLVGPDHYPAWLDPPAGKKGRGLCRFVVQDPHKETFHVLSAYTSLARYSKKRAVFHALALDPLGSAPQEAFRAELVRLSKRPGAQVDVITNGPGLVESHMLGQQLGLWFGTTSLNNAYLGVEGTPIRLWAHRSYVHSKVFYFDGAAVAVGSLNFDDSAVRCQESALICHDPELIEATEAMFALDFANSTEVSLSKEETVAREDLPRVPDEDKRDHHLQ
jgi:phosphatidylserine/phosphatidylglycerophosphate/cardiolipin synthase-like enzyme